MTRHNGMEAFVDDYLNSPKGERVGFLAGLSAAKLIVQNCGQELPAEDMISEISEHQQYFESLYYNCPERN